MIKHIINIMGTGTIEEIQQALVDVQEHIEEAEASGEHDRVDDMNLGFPKSAELKDQNVFLTIKLK
jgi:hypothetical protein